MFYIIILTLCFIFLTVRTIVLERIFIKKRNSIKIGNIYNNVYADSEGFYQVEVLDINNPKRFISFRKVGEEQVYLLFERYYANFECSYGVEVEDETKLVGIYKNREDAEKMQDKLYDDTTDSYYIEEWNVE